MNAPPQIHEPDDRRILLDRRSRGGNPYAFPRLDGVGSAVPFIFLGTALVLLVLLPILGQSYARPLQHDMRNIAEPGRGLVTRIHVAIALQGVALRDYLEAPSLGARRRYREASLTERTVSADLEPLARQLGADVRRRYDELRSLQARWHGAADSLVSAAAPPVDAGGPEELYEELLIAAARLDESIEGAIQDRRARIINAERIQQRLMFVVGIVALLAVAVVAWLGRRLRVIATAAELSHTELRRATESRERLMRGIGHDLKNPLNAIDGHAQLLEDGVKGELLPGQRDSVVRIRRSVRSLLKLVDDLLELSRAESGQLRMSIQPVDMKQLLCDTVGEHRAAAEARGHRLDVVIADEVDIVHTDPDRVAQVLGNLMSNAIKYTPPDGGISLRALLRSVEFPENGAAGWLAVEVADTGDGIPPHRMDEIFGEFTRLQTGTLQPGAGLGLAIARRIARLLGGDVTVSNGEERGAVFTLLLPPEGPAPDGGEKRGRHQRLAATR